MKVYIVKEPKDTSLAFRAVIKTLRLIKNVKMYLLSTADNPWGQIYQVELKEQKLREQNQN